MKWIPCSEKLPEIKPDCYCCEDGYELYESDTVLVWGQKDDSEFEYGIACMICNKVDGTKEWSGSIGVWDAGSCNIVAWCALPAPYTSDEVFEES